MHAAASCPSPLRGGTSSGATRTRDPVSKLLKSARSPVRRPMAPSSAPERAAPRPAEAFLESPRLLPWGSDYVRGKRVNSRAGRLREVEVLPFQHLTNACVEAQQRGGAFLFPARGGGLPDQRVLEISVACGCPSRSPQHGSAALRNLSALRILSGCPPARSTDPSARRPLTRFSSSRTFPRPRVPVRISRASGRIPRGRVLLRLYRAMKWARGRDVVPPLPEWGDPDRDDVQPE